MDEKDRIKLIRAGNDLFNKGEYAKAAEVFVKTDYRDGITRIADYYFFEKKQPLVALKYYQMSKREDKVQEIYERMKFAFEKMMGQEPAMKVELPPLKVSPKLKILAEEILRNNEESADNEKQEEQ